MPRIFFSKSFAKLKFLYVFSIILNIIKFATLLGCALGDQFAIPHEFEIVGSDQCDYENFGSEYVATFPEDIFVYNTVISIPAGASAMDFADVEVLLDNPKLKRPVRCGKKFSKGAARKLKASEIIFICKGGGKYAHLGRQARDSALLKTSENIKFSIF